MKKIKKASYEINFKVSINIQQHNALPKTYFPVTHVYLFSRNLKFFYVKINTPLIK